MVLTLYKFDSSPPVRSVFMVIEALKLRGVNFVDVNVLEQEHFKEEYLKLAKNLPLFCKKNPQHTIPMLADDDFYIWDSHAIATYLVTQYGENDILYPVDPKKRAIIDQRLHFDSSVLFPSLRGTVEPVFVWGEKSFKPENMAKMKAAYEIMEKFFSSPWLVGDDITLADICCVSTISTMNLFVPIDKNEFPNIANWLERCTQQEFYKKANEPGLEKFRALISPILKLKSG